MPRTRSDLVKFNRGLISRLARARVDLDRLAFSAEVMTNWMPRTLGSMMLRPGFGYIGNSASNAQARHLPFVKAIDDTAILEFTNGAMRVWVDDALIARVSVSSAVTNGNFDTDLSGWTDNDEAGASSVWVTGGYMGLTGTGVNAAIRDQQVTVAAPDQNVEHALRIVIQRGPVTLRVGSTSGGDEYISETVLGTGTHSLAFTPTGDFHIRFMSRLERQVLVDSCNVEGAGTMSITSPYLTADLGNIRGGHPEAQSGDVAYLACVGYQQRKVERRAVRSWSLVLYQPEDGPFRDENVGPTTITPSAVVGNITLLASAPLFRSGHVGALFKIISEGQFVTQTITAENTFTNAIRVTGIQNARIFVRSATGLSGSGSTVTLQRSLESESGPWTDISTHTANFSNNFDDGLDNQIAWYRIGVKTGDYAAGTIVVSLDYGSGFIDGVVRITAVTDSLNAAAEVLTDLGGTDATDGWAEGSWSDYRGWPSAVSFYEGRLGWAGKDNVWLSITDAFESFDAEFEGDAGPINRSIGEGPVDTINWMLPLQRLILGGQGAEHSCRSTSFDEPVTPTNFNIKSASTQGSGAVGGLKVDSRGLYVQRGGTRLMELAFNPEISEYQSNDLTLLIPEIGSPMFTRVAVQRQPDTRIHGMRSDGTAAVLVYDRAENVLCWCEVETDGDIEDVVVLPGEAGENEDRVYYSVARSINGSTVRHLERWAKESQCVGGTLNRQADAFVTFTNASPSVTVTGLTHLVGESVVVWQDGICPETDNDPKTFTVSGSGEITLDVAATTGIVGLPYEAQWRSARLGKTIAAYSRIDHLALVLLDTHAKGLLVGPSLDDDEMDYLPLRKDGEIVDPDTVYSEYDDQPVTFPSKWSNNSKVCLKAVAPRPATVAAAVAQGEGYA